MMNTSDQVKNVRSDSWQLSLCNIDSTSNPIPPNYSSYTSIEATCLFLSKGRQGEWHPGPVMASGSAADWLVQGIRTVLVVSFQQDQYGELIDLVLNSVNPLWDQNPHNTHLCWTVKIRARKTWDLWDLNCICRAVSPVYTKNNNYKWITILN